MKMKTPISYYGGKQSMINDILPLIPEHKIYCEPFFGGGAIFWAKEPVKCEIINDLNMNVVNFYEVLKHAYFPLKKRIEATLHSRETYKKAMLIYQTPELFADDPVVRAWAFYVCCNQGFGCKIGTWGYDRAKRAHTIQNKIDQFSGDLAQRLKYVQIESNDAVKVIQSRDTEETFHYVDPPYVGSDQGHYGGYTEMHFKELLKCLEKIKGKFLLSSYPHPMLSEFVKRNGWHSKSIDKLLCAGNGAKQSQRKRKIEVLTANFEI